RRPPVRRAGALARCPFLRPGERARAGIAALALGRLRPSPSLDERTFGAWLRDRRQSPAAIDALWNLIALPTLNLPAQEASLALAVKVFRTGLLDAADAGDVGYATVPLSELHAEPAGRVLGAAAEIEERTEDLRRRFVPALEGLFPEARRARVVSFFVTREPAATFRQAPGTARLRPPARTALRGLVLAGAWTDTGWPATMEGAVRSGMAAASAALQSLERPLPAEVRTGRGSTEPGGSAEPSQAVP